MSLLQNIHRGKEPAPRRVLLYGPHGTGKSTFAASAPAPIFIQTEDGLGEIDCHKFPLATTFAEVMKAIEALYVEHHEYRTVGIDSLDWLERVLWSKVCDDKSVENIEDIAFGKGYAYALSDWRDLLAGLDALRNERGMTIVLIAHSKIERFANPETDSYDRYSPRLHKLASAIVQEWVDEILFASYTVYVKQTDEGFNRKKNQGVGTGERVLYTTERPSHVAKNRLRLPDELPLDWAAYAHYFTQPHTNEGESNG